MAGMNEKKTRNEMYEESARRGSNLDRMRWFYDHMWSDIVVWNCMFARDLIVKINRRGNVISRGDMDIYVTHFSNTACAQHGLRSSGLFLSAAAPFATAFCGITPLAMLARWFGPRMLWLTLNGVQRSLFYATAWLTAAQSHQHWSYFATLEDKHGVAEMLRRADPTLDKNVDDLLREISEGVVIVWPG